MLARFYIDVYILDMTPCEPFLLSKKGFSKFKLLALITLLLLEYLYIYIYIIYIYIHIYHIYTYIYIYIYIYIFPYISIFCNVFF